MNQCFHLLMLDVRVGDHDSAVIDVVEWSAALNVRLSVITVRLRVLVDLVASITIMKPCCWVIRSSTGCCFVPNATLSPLI